MKFAIMAGVGAILDRVWPRPAKACVASPSASIEWRAEWKGDAGG
jgi:hypothetical protein